MKIVFSAFTELPALCTSALDDIIFSRTVKEHLERLKEVFEHLQQAGLELMPSKCCLLRKHPKSKAHFNSYHDILPVPPTIHNWWDASSDRLEAVLSQEKDDREHVVACTSRTLTKAERCYSATFKAMLGNPDIQTISL